MQASSNIAPLYTEITRHAKAVLNRAVFLRRKMHAYPELSGKERKTAALIHRELLRLGLKPFFHVQKTGVSASIGEGSGPIVVLRADIDALAVEEKTGVSYRSRVPGVMHACGHDMHAAMLYGAAAVLWQLKRRLRGRVVLLFQPSEEKEPGGARSMIKESAFPSNADAVFCFHVSTEYTTGMVGIKQGTECAGVLGFEVEVRGVGGHGAIPENAVDPIVCSTAMILSLQTLVSREIPPHEPSALNIGSIHAGTEAANVIPEKSVFSGTFRTFSQQRKDSFCRRMKEMVEAVASAYRTACSVKFIDSYPPGYNDPVLAVRIAEALRKHLGPQAVVMRQNAAMFGEDFSFYQQKAPGVLAHLGVRPPHCERMPSIHSPYFLPDEKAMLNGIIAHCIVSFEIAGQGEI